MVITDTLFLYTFNLESKDRFYFGWWHIAFFFLLLAINLFDFIINTVIHGAISCCRNRNKKIVKIKQIEKPDEPEP